MEIVDDDVKIFNKPKIKKEEENKEKDNECDDSDDSLEKALKDKMNSNNKLNLTFEEEKENYKDDKIDEQFD